MPRSRLWHVLLFYLIGCLVAASFAQEFLANPRCNEYPDRGTCEDNRFVVKYYYDRFDHRCRKFYYGGCDGNTNRFDTLSECELECSYDSYLTETSRYRCFLPHDPGTCWGNFARWYFDSTLKRCICSWWSGCGGNENRFYSYAHCMQVCGAHANSVAGEGESNADVTVYESPLERPGSIHAAMLASLTTPQPLKPVITRPRIEQPLGGNLADTNRVFVPQPPPVFSDTDVIYDDEEDDESEAVVSDNDGTEEWSARTEVRLFPIFRATLDDSGNIAKKREAQENNRFLPMVFQKSAVKVEASSEELQEPTDDSEVFETPFKVKAPLNQQPSSPSAPDEPQKMAEANETFETPFRSQNKPAAVEVFQTPFRRNPIVPEFFETPIVRRTAGLAPPHPTTQKPSTTLERPPPGSRETFEVPFSSPRKPIVPEVFETDFRQRRELSPPGRTPPQSQGSSMRFSEWAETPFRRPTFVQAPVLPGYALVRDRATSLPQPVPQALINELIQRHLSLRQRAEATREVHVTPFRRAPSGTAPMSYAEKRRRWKEEMKRKWRLRKLSTGKQPPRQLLENDSEHRFYVTYSPQHRVYQVSRRPPPAYEPSARGHLPAQPVQPQPRPTLPPSATTTTTTPPPTTTTTTTPKPVVLPIEEVPVAVTSGAVKVSAIKPTLSDNLSTMPKQLLYMDDYEAALDDVDDYEQDEVEEDLRRPTPAPPAQLTPSRPPALVQSPIVFPTAHVVPTVADYVMPSPDDDDDLVGGSSTDNDNDNDDDDEDDLFFWRPVRPAGVPPRPPPRGDDFEITVHNAQRL